jgi:hypothetical protein
MLILTSYTPKTLFTTTPHPLDGFFFTIYNPCTLQYNLY